MSVAAAQRGHRPATLSHRVLDAMYALARELGVEVMDGTPSDGAAAELLSIQPYHAAARECRTALVVVGRYWPPLRKAYMIAHELAHLQLHEGQGDLRRCDPELRLRVEAEADQAARGLIREAKRRLKEAGGDGKAGDTR